MDLKEYYNSKGQEYYESNYGITVSGNLRGCTIFDTYEGKAFTSNSKIIGLEFENFIIGESGETSYKIGVGNIIKSILENKKYSSEEEFLKELNILYKSKIEKIIK